MPRGNAVDIAAEHQVAAAAECQRVAITRTGEFMQIAFVFQMQQSGDARINTERVPGPQRGVGFNPHRRCAAGRR